MNDMTPMTHRERLQTVLQGEKPDRVPVALWRHFPVDDQDPGTLAEAVLDFQGAWDFDFVKVTPASSFCLRDWGSRDVWEGNSEGTRRYTQRVIANPADWEKVKELDPDSGSLGAQLDCLRRIRQSLPADTPVIQTIFNPLSQAKNLAGKELLLEHLHRWPDAVQAGLDTILRTTVRFTEACMALGIDGIFLAVQHASFRILSAEEYSRWGTPGDRRILDAAGDGWLNVLHLHGDAVLFDLAGDYPVAVVNWHDREAGPALREGRDLCGKTVCGGWRQWETIAYGDPNRIRTEAQDAIAQTGGKNLILGTGCVTPIITPRSCLAAAARAGVPEK
jgi:uroporphyrinogen decarboxylase